MNVINATRKSSSSCSQIREDRGDGAMKINSKTIKSDSVKIKLLKIHWIEVEKQRGWKKRNWILYGRL
jgi:hypothetical protein